MPNLYGTLNFPVSLFLFAFETTGRRGCFEMTFNIDVRLVEVLDISHGTYVSPSRCLQVNSSALDGDSDLAGIDDTVH